MSSYQGAERSRDLTRLFVDEPTPETPRGLRRSTRRKRSWRTHPGSVTPVCLAIRELWEKVLEDVPHFEEESPLPTLISGDLAVYVNGRKRRRGRSRPKSYADKATAPGSACWISRSSCCRVIAGVTRATLRQRLEQADGFGRRSDTDDEQGPTARRTWRWASFFEMMASGHHHS